MNLQIVALAQLKKHRAIKNNGSNLPKISKINYYMFAPHEPKVLVSQNY